jgi:hypothetical protein
MRSSGLMTESMIEQGWAALNAGAAARARDAFEQALRMAESGRALEGLGQALYLQRDYSGAIAQHERAYAAYRREGQTVGAARVARILAWITSYAPSNGCAPRRN